MFNDIDELQNNITPIQLIRFGLNTLYGSKLFTDKVTKMIGGNISTYLDKEYMFYGLLKICGIKDQDDPTIFIRWLKTNSNYVDKPEGFLIQNNSE